MNLSDSLRLYQKEIRKVPLLKPEEEIELARKEELPASKNKRIQRDTILESALTAGVPEREIYSFLREGNGKVLKA